MIAAIAWLIMFASLLLRFLTPRIKNVVFVEHLKYCLCLSCDIYLSVQSPVSHRLIVGIFACEFNTLSVLKCQVLISLYSMLTYIKYLPVYVVDARQMDIILRKLHSHGAHKQHCGFSI